MKKILFRYIGPISGLMPALAEYIKQHGQQ